jgi:cation diffusion facilitator family transporter
VNSPQSLPSRPSPPPTHHVPVTMHQKSMDDLYRQSRRAACWGIAISCGLGGVKLAGGVFGNSVALVSDAVHSLGDALTSAGVFLALVWSQQPADREHPYGHTRAEAVAGSNVALVLILSALGIGWEALVTWNTASPPPEIYTLIIAAVSVFFMEGMYWYKKHIARQTGSRAMLATAWDHRLDALGSLTVLGGLALARVGWHAADHLAALAVALIIFWTGIHLFWTSLQELMDRQAEPVILEEVRREALAVPGVLGVEKLLVRKTGLEYLADIHVEVDSEMTVREGHAIGHAVKDRLLQRIVTLKDVLVHIEPAAGEQAR